MRRRYQVIEKYRGGALLCPPVVVATCQSRQEVRCYVAWAIPRSQAADWSVRVNGTEIPATRYLPNEGEDGAAPAKEQYGVA